MKEVSEEKNEKIDLGKLFFTIATVLSIIVIIAGLFKFLSWYSKASYNTATGMVNQYNIYGEKARFCQQFADSPVSDLPVDCLWYYSRYSR